MDAEEGEIVESATQRYTTPRPLGGLHGTTKRSKSGRNRLKFNRHPFSKSVRNRDDYHRVPYSATSNPRDSTRKSNRKDSGRAPPFSYGGITPSNHQQKQQFSKKRSVRNVYTSDNFSKRGGGGEDEPLESRKRSASAYKNDPSLSRKKRKRLRKPKSKKFMRKAKKFRMRLNSEGGENEHFGKKSSRPSNLQARKGDRPGFRRHARGRRWTSRSPPRRLWRPKRRDSKRNSKMRQKFKECS